MGLVKSAHSRNNSEKYLSLCVVIVLTFLTGTARGQVSVTTYHYNNMRTGWNSLETVLTPSNVSGLQLEASVALDDQVDAQPLVFNGAVYVVSENNSVYEINPDTGNVTASTNLGSPVTTPTYGCNEGHVGITSTPVIDPNSDTLYVMAYTYDGNGNPIFQLHALDTGSLADKVPPRTVVAARGLTNGTMEQFDAAVQRQRPGLLLVNGVVYAGFGSFCDNVSPNIARGWILAWQAGTLTPRAAHLNDRHWQSANDFFLDSVWMSGYGLAADSPGNIYFATGNSDFSGASYNAMINPSESVVEMSPDLTTIESYFTPYGSRGMRYMEAGDLDLSSGGVLLTPDGYATAAGKIGRMFLLKQGNLGGHRPGNFLASAFIGQCWCGESYYQGTDGNGRIVSSGGKHLIVWLEPALQKESETQQLQTGAGSSPASHRMAIRAR
jgi:outer membrane protein assembly factor BamB